MKWEPQNLEWTVQQDAAIQYNEEALRCWLLTAEEGVQSRVT
jgi:hypothetical protein